MSPRAACRLEALGFSEVYDYTPGKVDWIGAGLPIEGKFGDAAMIGDFARDDAATCSLEDTVTTVRERIERSPYGFALTVTASGTVLGRVRGSRLGDDPDATAEQVMEPGPSTVRPGNPAGSMLHRLREADYKTLIVTDRLGHLVGIATQDDLEAATDDEH